MDKDLEAMTQLMQQNGASLATARQGVEAMQRALTASDNQRKWASLAQQLARLRVSAHELNSTTADIETQVSAMKELQDEMLRLAAVLSQRSAIETAKTVGEETGLNCSHKKRGD